MAKMGRPKIEIDKKEFEKLCALHATLIEFAGWFDCCEDTIESWCKETYGKTFSEVFRQKASKGKISVRRKQLEIALNGNVPMLIWLGKQKLGQKDFHQLDVDVQPIKFQYDPEEK